MLVLHLLALAVTIHCLPWDGILPTRSLDAPQGHQEVPEPTPMPLPSQVDLRLRQASGDYTCGYYNKSISDALYCLSGAHCATNEYDAMGCCTNLDNCPIPTTCIDSTALKSYAASFLSNPYVTSCTNPASPVCITEYYVYDYIATGWDCYSSGYDRTETYYTVVSNGTIPPVQISNAYYSPVIISSPKSSSPTTSASTTTTTPPPAPTSPTPTPAATPSSSSSSTPVGAIVGGTVGGVAAIAIVAALIFFCLRRNSKDENVQPQVAAPMSTQPMSTQPQPPTQGLPPQTEYPQPYQPPYQSPYPVQQVAPIPIQQNPYPEKLSPSETVYTYGSPHLAQSEPIGGAPPYSPGASTVAPVMENVNPGPSPVPAEYHELGER